MILKERNAAEHRDADRLSEAGAKAEEQMAFYLRRVFQEREDVLVFNDLRLVDENGDTAQIDHLVMHGRGFVLIKSKSVTTEIRVNGRRVAGDRRDCYWLYVVTNCSAIPTLQEPVKDPARLEWHEVTKVAHYYLSVNAVTQPMEVCEDEAPYGKGEQ